MHWAILDDGRKVVVDTSAQQTRVVAGSEYFLDRTHVNVLLDGHWAAVKERRLKKAEYGNPFGELK